MKASLSPFSLHAGEVRGLVPAWVAFVIVGDGIEKVLGCRSSLLAHMIGDADDGRRVHAAAEFGKDGGARSGASIHGLPE